MSDQPGTDDVVGYAAALEELQQILTELEAAGTASRRRP